MILSSGCGRIMKTCLRRPGLSSVASTSTAWGSIAAILAYLDRVDPEEAKAARKRYGCLTPWQDDPAGYGRAALHLNESPCEEGVLAELRKLLNRRLAYVRRDGESFFDATQNARVVRAAEHYYRLMYRSARESWNLRDRHMFDTLVRLLAARGGDAKSRCLGA